MRMRGIVDDIASFEKEKINTSDAGKGSASSSLLLAIFKPIPSVSTKNTKEEKDEQKDYRQLFVCDARRNNVLFFSITNEIAVFDVM